MRYGVDKGHNCPHNIGAVSIKSEDDLTRAVGDKVIEYLRELGNKVTDCTPVTAKSQEDSLYMRVTVANRDNVDFFLSIHFNAGGGHGSEVFAISQKGKEVAQRVLNELVSLGFVNRGVKDGSKLYVVRHTDAPAMLIEVAFVDSKEDMDRVDTLGIDKIARAIVKGITGQEVQESKPIENIVERIDNMKIIDVQRLCNKLGVTDHEGKALVEDNINGKRTEAARVKLKELLQYVLK